MKEGQITTGWELLAIAICQTAVDDYEKELAISEKTGIKTYGAADIERFFASDWGYMLSFGAGEIILEKIRKERRPSSKRKKYAKKEKAGAYD